MLHVCVAGGALGHIKDRSIDTYTKKESDMRLKGGIDRAEFMAALKGKGTKMEKLSFHQAEADTSTFQYVNKIKSLNVFLRCFSNIVDWAEKLYGQSISVVTA
ncbi:unnamed protein product [Cochlearia groenlandica]